MKTNFCLLFFFIYLSGIGLAQIQVKENHKNFDFLIYTPKHDSPSYDFPVILFLHGIDERGNNLDLVKLQGPPKLIENGSWPYHLNFIVISPQLPKDYNHWPLKKLDDFIDHVINKYNIDKNRVYLTGLSLGGSGTWKYAAAHPEKLAAIIPICGHGNPKSACNLVNLPVWAFHGQEDKIVPPEGTTNIIEPLRNCNPPTNNVNLTLYAGVGHDAWTQTYNNEKIYEWLLSHEKNKTYSFKSHEKDTNNPLDYEFKEIGKLPVALKESSGMVINGRNQIWSHNDSGNLPALIKIDTSGEIIKHKRITRATNFDWEDLAKDDYGNFYIGDFGNNLNTRKSFQIYKIPNPDAIDSERIEAKLIEFRLPDQHKFPPAETQRNFDFEAMISVDNYLYIFSKNRTTPYTGYTKMYRIPNEPGIYIADLIDSVHLGNGMMLQSWITSAAISTDKTKLVLLSHDKIWLFYNFGENNFFKGKSLHIDLPHHTQKEAISFLNSNELIITDELFRNKIGGKIYKISLHGSTDINCLE